MQGVGRGPGPSYHRDAGEVVGVFCVSFLDFYERRPAKMGWVIGPDLERVSDGHLYRYSFIFIYFFSAL